MSRMTKLQHLTLSALRWLRRHRYLKFGLVGASGTVVNLMVLHLGHEYLFNEIEASFQKPYLSLALAIALSTLNNFTWNRLWTWSDRVKKLEKIEGAGHINLHVLGIEFGQYITASAFGSTMQYILTLLLTGTLDYRVANITAILAASVSNFLANDRWTFRRRTPK